jgi:REP element-mobilizing transposase RayT
MQETAIPCRDATMPSTYSSLHYHLVFSTKERLPLIGEEWQPRLHEYLGGMVRGMDGIALGVGGMADHVHLLVGLKPIHRLSDFMRDLKKDATRWIHDLASTNGFAWQEGYAAITVSPSGVEAVRDYVLQQEKHHRGRSFREELVMMLDKAGIGYDDRYLD